MKQLKVSQAAKEIIAEIGVQMDLIVFEGLKKLRADLLATLHLVEEELHEHDVEYHHKTSPAVKTAVRKAIHRLGGKPRIGADK